MAHWPEVEIGDVARELRSPLIDGWWETPAGGGGAGVCPMSLCCPLSWAATYVSLCRRSRDGAHGGRGKFCWT